MDRALDFYDKAARRDGYYAEHVHAYRNEQMRLMYEAARNKNAEEQQERRAKEREARRHAPMSRYELACLLCSKRADARERKAWNEADKLRDEMLALGANVRDTQDGYVLEMPD